MNLQKEIRKVMNLDEPELNDLHDHAEEYEPLVKELMKEYRQFSDMMAKKSRLMLLESNYDYLIFRAKFETRKTLNAIMSMSQNLDNAGQAFLKQVMTRLERLKNSSGTEGAEFES